MKGEAARRRASRPADEELREPGDRKSGTYRRDKALGRVVEVLCRCCGGRVRAEEGIELPDGGIGCLDEGCPSVDYV